MKSIFRKFSFLAFIVVVSLGVLVGYGFSDFLFGGVATAPSTTIENVDSFVDPIRQNAVFNEPGDVGSVGTKYYDVYFMAQSINGGAKDTNNDGVLNNYGYYDIPDGYSNNENIAHFGAFYGENDDGSFYDLPVNLALDTNRYFKKLENVAEVSTYQMEEIGEPKINRVFDGNSNANNGGWQLEFICWTTSPMAIYGSDNNPWPSVTYDNGLQGYKVYSWYPGTDDTTFSTFYTNSLLSIYDTGDGTNENNDGDAVYLINGRKSIFVYPVYSVGKDYSTSQTNRNMNTIVDSLQLRNYSQDSSSSNYSGPIDAKTPIFDGQLTSELNSIQEINDAGNYKIFRLDNILFEKDDSNKYLLAVDRSMNGWKGDKFLVTKTDDGYQSTKPMTNSQATDYSNDFIDTAFDFHKNISGLFNVYIVSKCNFSGDERGYNSREEALAAAKNRGITADDAQYIDNFFESKNIKEYKTVDCDMIVTTQGQITIDDYWWLGTKYSYNFADAWDYYIVYERVYEPRLVGGTTTGGFDYSSNSDYAFTRVGATGEDKDRYVLRNVYLTSQRNVTNNDTYLSNNFGIQLLEDANITYELITRDEAQNTADDWPEIITATKNDGNFVYEKYLSKSILKNGSDGLIKTADNDNNNLDGVFNLFIDVEYGDVNGVTQPTNIYVYAYQFKNLFVNLYEQTSDIKYYAGNYSDLGQTNNYVVTAACYMRIQDINQGDLLSSDMVIDKYTYNVIDAATGAVNASETGETETLGEYVSRLQSSNKCLQELTTGRYITTNTLNGNDGGFVINKNYAFIVCDMPSSLVS